MKKPDGYIEAPSYTGDFERMTPGGYICKIKNVKEETNNGYWKFVIAFDVADGEHAGFYGRQFDRFGGNWPGVYRQNVVGKDGKCSPFFKGMITAIEEGNPGYTFDFDNEKGLVGKLFGGVFGEEEYMGRMDGEVKTSCKCVQIRSVRAIRDGNFKIPAKKEYRPPESRPIAVSDMADVSAEECPF